MTTGAPVYVLRQAPWEGSTDSLLEYELHPHWPAEDQGKFVLQIPVREFELFTGVVLRPGEIVRLRFHAEPCDTPPCPSLCARP